MLPSGNADQFIRCQDCGDIFFLASPEENRRRYEQHLQFCKKKKVSKEKKQLRKKVDSGESAKEP